MKKALAQFIATFALISSFWLGSNVAIAQQKALNKTVWKVEQILPDGTVFLNKLNWNEHESMSGDYEYSFIQFRSPKAYLIVLECYGETGQMKFWEGNQIDFISESIKSRKDCEESEVIEGSYFYAIDGEELTLIPLAQKKAPKKLTENERKPKNEKSFLEVGDSDVMDGAEELDDVEETTDEQRVPKEKPLKSRQLKEDEMQLPKKVIDKLEDRNTNPEQ